MIDEQGRASSDIVDATQVNDVGLDLGSLPDLQEIVIKCVPERQPVILGHPKCPHFDRAGSRYEGYPLLVPATRTFFSLFL